MSQIPIQSHVSLAQLRTAEILPERWERSTLETHESNDDGFKLKWERPVEADKDVS